MSAAGILFLAASTGRILLGFRSSAVRAPHRWSVIGGSIERGEGPEEAAVREAREEVKYLGPIVLVPSYVYVRPPKFSYHNFIGLVPAQFRPKLNEEHVEAEWFDLDALPEPLHHGTAMLMREASEQILDLHKTR
jgi:8-oxo-dGTP pyrophosphatase MutT (NUDIX family)